MHQTDASDYGIGGMLYQLVNNIMPILGHSHFLLKTDHKNLTYV